MGEGVGVKLEKKTFFIGKFARNQFRLLKYCDIGGIIKMIPLSCNSLVMDALNVHPLICFHKLISSQKDKMYRIALIAV